MISNIHNDYDIELSYDENILKIVENHKRLGVNISSNNKWSNHTDSIINSATKQITYLRKLKFQLPKHTLSKLYCTYIRPLLEYASEVWDGCNLSDTNRLEQVQLNATRIVIGLPVFSSLRSLYLETGWETLAERRKTKKLILMHKIIKNETPSYLNDLLPSLVNDVSNYNLRNNTNYDLSFCRLCSYETSYFSSTLKLWNDLNTETPDIPTLSQFKSSIRHQPPRVGKHLLVGERKYNIILTRIRHRCSSLNADLFHVNIVPYSNCSCGVLVENAEHYLFECTLYNTQRQRLLQTIHQIQTVPTVNFDLLTNGSNLHDFETNRHIILVVLNFIKDTKRFD